MNSTYTVGYGSKFYYATTTLSGGTYTVGSYTELAQTIDLGGPMPEVGDINITNNSSPNNTKEHAPGMIEPGEQEFELVYTKAQQAVLHGMLGDGLIYGFKDLYPDGSTYTFLGYLKKIGMEGKTEDDAIKCKVTVKLTSKPTFTAGT